MNQEMISTITNTLVSLSVTVVLALITVATEYVRRWLKAKIGEANFHALSQMAHSAVTAAEQVGASFGFDNEKKKDFAVQALQLSAQRLGLTLTLEQASDLIESVVRQAQMLWKDAKDREGTVVPMGGDNIETTS